MSKLQVDVMLDIHEDLNTHLREIFEEHDEVREVSVADMEKLFGAGDILIAGTAFERKTWPDYVGSIKDGRLQKQTETMKQVFRRSYVLVDGDMDGTEELTHTQMEPASLRGHAASLTARSESGVQSVIPCSNNELLADMAVRLARKHLEDPSNWNVQATVDTKEPTLKRIIASVDGVGPGMADKLYAEFDTLREIQATLEFGAITDIDGLGPKTEANLKEALL